MAPPQPHRLTCEQRKKDYFYGVKHCNGVRNCLEDTGYHVGFDAAICVGARYLNVNKNFTFDIYTNDRKTHLAHMTSGWLQSGRLDRCLPDKPRSLEDPGANAGPEPFTVDIPGIQDIIKVKDWESKALKRERYERFKTRNSAVPQALQWIPPLLTKLDNAQDLLFTALAIAYPLLKFAPKFLLGPIGWILTINDFLNILT